MTSGNEEVANRVSAVRCAREGIKLVLNGIIPKEDVDELADLYTLEPPEFIYRCLQKVRENIDRIEDIGDADAAIKAIETMGILIDRMTKYHLMTSPGLEKHNNYARSRHGIARITEDGTEIETKTWKELSQ